MDNKLEEEYVFYRNATGDLAEAYNTLNVIKQYKRQITISALIKTSIIAYSRPFKMCHGKYDRYNIKGSIVPDKFKSLHQKIIKYRDQIFAHHDILIREPKLHKWNLKKRTVYPIVFKGFSPKDFIHEIDKTKQLIDELIKLLNMHILKLEKKLP